MAWDLRYTSVESGPTGRSGFQFVATTPGTPPEVTRAVTPYMAYRPPPDAPSAPDPEQLARFPVAFAYGREGDHAVLVRCRYTGRDYSGRYGNFSGHAVVATPAEMEGLRPIELWASPVWSGPPGGTPDLVPGEAFDPDSLVTWLGREDAHARLAALLDAVTTALAEGHGRVVLVSEDGGLVARWIAVLSYSLPAGLASAMSFTTYTAAPESAPQLVVGTVPGTWPGRAFNLDEPAPGAPDHAAPGRFARVIANCWRTGDLDGIDAVGELLTAATGPSDTWNTDAGPSDAWNTDVGPGGGWNTDSGPGGTWGTGVRPADAWNTDVGQARAWGSGAGPSDTWNTNVGSGGAWGSDVGPSGSRGTGVRPAGDPPGDEPASGSTPRTSEGRWDTTSGTTGAAADGPGGQPRTRPTDGQGGQPPTHSTDRPSDGRQVRPTDGPGGQPPTHSTDGPSDGRHTRPADRSGSQPPTPSSHRPGSQPPTHPADGLDGQPPTRSSDRPGGQPPTRSSDRPGGQPPTHSTDRPNAGRHTRPADGPRSQPPTRSTDRPGSQPPTRSTDRPGSQPPTHSTDRPGSQPPTHSTDRPGSQPPTHSTDRPSEGRRTRPADGPGGQPPTRPADGSGRRARARSAGGPGDGTPTRSAGGPGGRPPIRPADGPGDGRRTRPADESSGWASTHSSGVGGVLGSADGAAALLALCRGDASVSAEEEAAAAELVRRGGAPAWIWPSLAGSLPRLGFELAAALAGAAPQIAEHCVTLALADPALLDRLPAFQLRDGMPARFRTAVAGASGLDALAAIVRLADQVGGRIESEEVIAAAAACTRRGAGDIAAALSVIPGAWRAAMVSGVLAGLETAGAPVRRSMLDHDAVEALGDHDWKRAPRTGGLVLSARGDRHEATAGLVELEQYGLPDIEDLLAGLWDAPPTPDDCVRLIERLGTALTKFDTLRRLPRRAFETAPLDAEETVRLAELVRDRLPTLAGPARIVLGHGEALRAEPEHEVARVLGRMDSGDPLTVRVCASVAGALAQRSARSRADILAAASDTVRSGLAGHWLDTAPGKGARVDLAEIEVRLHHARKPVARLTEWGDGLGRFARRHVESALTDRDPHLASAWRALRRRGA